MKIIAISGSLRKNSFNTQLLKNVEALALEGVEVELFSIEKIPFYSEDIDDEDKPIEVQRLINKVNQADAILFSTPEYNHCISGVLKNTIDWLSRPAFDSPLKNKACGMLSVSRSPIGGARAQMSLTRILTSALSRIYPSVEYLLFASNDTFNPSGKLIDETAKRRLQRYVLGFLDWI